jgi:hypothetical protein
VTERHSLSVWSPLFFTDGYSTAEFLNMTIEDIRPAEDIAAFDIITFAYLP